MTLAGSYLDGMLSLLKRDALLFASYRLRFITQIIAVCFSVVVFYYISRLVHVHAFSKPDQYFAFVVVGIVTLEVLSATLATMPARVRQELVVGTLEKLILSPFGCVAAIAAMTLFPFAQAIIQGLATIGFAAIVFGLPLHWSTAALAIPTAFLALLAFMPFALFMGAGVIVVKQVQSGVGFLLTGISLIGGFLFPPSLLPGWIEWASKVQPFTPALQLQRKLLVGTPLDGSVELALLKMVLSAVVLLPVSLWALSAAIRIGQRRGTVIEY
jgi:ABC-2 type transport system permease protein